MGARESVGRKNGVIERKNIKIIPIKLSQEERKLRRQEILKALIREDNA